MNKEKFIDFLKAAIENSAIEDMFDLLESPPGRSPEKDLINASNWTKSLTKEEKKILEYIIINTSQMTVFGLLCYLDGIRLNNSLNGGELLLYYKKDDSMKLINTEEGDFLHDLYNSD